MKRSPCKPGLRPPAGRLLGVAHGQMACQTWLDPPSQSVWILSQQTDTHFVQARRKNGQMSSYNHCPGWVHCEVCLGRVRLGDQRVLAWHMIPLCAHALVLSARPRRGCMMHSLPPPDSHPQHPWFCIISGLQVQDIEPARTPEGL